MEFFFTPAQKKRADDDIALYKRERRFEVDAAMKEERRYALQDIADSKILAEKAHLETLRTNAVEVGKSEHEFHSKKEMQGIELAKVEAQIEFKKELLAQIKSIPELKEIAAREVAKNMGFETAIKHLEGDVTRLDELVKFMASLLPKVELDKIGITLNADIAVNDKKEEKK